MQKAQYCKKHGIPYQGYMCPECIEELKKDSETREQKKRERKEIWDSIIWSDGKDPLSR
jgi:hypothetical protein